MELEVQVELVGSKAMVRDGIESMEAFRSFPTDTV